MCLLPPNCLFCAHYHNNEDLDAPDCDAFAEIPEAIFMGGNEHLTPVSGDHGVLFSLDPEMAEEFSEVQDLRSQIRKQTN